MVPRAQSFLLIDVKTLDAAGATHIADRHMPPQDRTHLAAHRYMYVTQRAVEQEYSMVYGALRQYLSLAQMCVRKAHLTR